MTRPRSPYMAHVRQIPGNYVTRSEAAQELGVSVWKLNTLRGRHGLKAPSKVTRVGTVPVYLYSRDDIAELRAFLDRGPTVRDLDSTAEADLRKARNNLYKQRQRCRAILDDPLTDPDRRVRTQKKLDGISDTLTEINTSLRNLR